MRITKTQFAESLGLARTTLSAWKSNNTYPPVETVMEIANRIEVSVDWLLYGESQIYKSIEGTHSHKSRDAVRKRIYEGMFFKKTCGLPDYGELDYSDETQLKILHDDYYTEKFLSYHKLKNWAKGRCEIDYSLFAKLADDLLINTQYLLIGSDEVIPNDYDSKLYALAKEYEYQLYELKSLGKPRLDLALGIIDNLSYVQSQIESFE